MTTPTISLSDGTTTVELHPDLFWSDELTWSPVQQTSTRTVTGALVVQSQAMVGGRPITLESVDDNSAWMWREVVEAVRNWAAVPGKELTLTLHGDTYSVIFRHQDGGFESSPVIFYNDVISTDWYTVVIRLQEI
jgi:hypothetical protein